MDDEGQLANLRSEETREEAARLARVRRVEGDDWRRGGHISPLKCLKRVNVVNLVNSRTDRHGGRRDARTDVDGRRSGALKERRLGRQCSPVLSGAEHRSYRGSRQA